MKSIWQIIQIDNFGRDYIPERVVADNIEKHFEGMIMLDALCDWPEKPNDVYYVIRKKES